MATQYFFNLGSEELGPVTFRDLVDLVRAGVLSENDLVRPTWRDNAQRADSIVGLFYMSRLPVAKPEMPQAQSAVELEPEAAEPTGAHVAPMRPEWLVRLLELEQSLQGNSSQTGVMESTIGVNSPRITEQSFADAEIRSGEDLVVAEVTEPPLGIDRSDSDAQSEETMGQSSSWTTAVDAALSQVDARNSRPNKQSRWRIWHACVRFASTIRQALESRELLGRAFRIGSAIVVANLSAFWIMNWSERQALRFPARPGQRQEVASELPLIGKCDSTEYAVLVFHFVLLCGGGAYGVATFLVSRAEE